MILKNKKNKQFKKNQAGFMMIEATFSIFIVGTILITFMAVMASVYRTEFSKRDLIIASNLAQEGIEIVRNIRDNNWKQGKKAFETVPFTSGGNYCVDYVGTVVSDCGDKFLMNSVNSFYQYTVTGAYTVTKYSRTIVINGSGDSRTITVTVNWDGKNMTMTDTLYAWGDQE